VIPSTECRLNKVVPDILGTGCRTYQNNYSLAKLQDVAGGEQAEKYGGIEFGGAAINCYR
jgi:hypothetical protein